MKVSMIFTCPGCETDNTMKFIRPTAMAKATCFVTCKECASKFTVVVSKEPFRYGAATYKAIPDFVSEKAHQFQLQKMAALKSRALEV